MHPSCSSVTSFPAPVEEKNKKPSDTRSAAQRFRAHKLQRGAAQKPHAAVRRTPKRQGRRMKRGGDIKRDLVTLMQGGGRPWAHCFITGLFPPVTCDLYCPQEVKAREQRPQGRDAPLCNAGLLYRGSYEDTGLTGATRCHWFYFLIICDSSRTRFRSAFESCWHRGSGPRQHSQVTLTRWPLPPPKPRLALKNPEQVLIRLAAGGGPSHVEDAATKGNCGGSALGFRPVSPLRRHGEEKNSSKAPEEIAKAFRMQMCTCVWSLLAWILITPTCAVHLVDKLNLNRAWITVLPPHTPTPTALLFSQGFFQ